MFKRSVLIAVVVSLLGFVDAAWAVVIEGTELPKCTEITNQLAPTHFVRFTSNDGHVTFEKDGGRLGIYGTKPDGFEGCADLNFHEPIVVFFVDPADPNRKGVVNGKVSAIWGDGGGDIDFLTLKAFDVNGNQIGEVKSQGCCWQTIAFTGQGIHELRFAPSNGAPPSSDTFIDRLEFPKPVGGGGRNLCKYADFKVKARRGCRTCPQKRPCTVDSGKQCSVVKDCKKRIKETIACPNGPGKCKIKSKRCACN